MRQPPDHSWLKMECVCCGYPEHRPWWRRKKKPAEAEVPFGVVMTQGEPLDAVEMLAMAREHMKVDHGPERGVAICLEAALLELRKERLANS